MYKLLKAMYNRIRGVEKMKKSYTIIVHKEDDIFWAECKEIEGCFAQSKNIEELKRLMINSIYLYYNENTENKPHKIENEKEIKLELSYA